MATDLKTFEMADVQPFFPAVDEATLPNVGLRLAASRSTIRRQRRRLTKVLNQRRKVVETIGRLPTSGESLHIILNGECALFDFIPAIITLSGKPIDSLTIATLGFSKRNVEALGQLIDAGQVLQVALLCSHFFAAQDAEIYAHACELFARHGFPIAAMRTHAKILLIGTGDHRLIVESSANLRSCHNVEQCTIFADAELFDFHAKWINDLLRRGAEPSGETPKARTKRKAKT